MTRQRKITNSWKDRHPRTVFVSLLCMAGMIVGVSVFLLLRSNGEPTPKKDLVVRDSLDVFLDNVHPNDFSLSNRPIEPLPEVSPPVVVSKETRYLARFVGPYLKIAAKPGEPKSKSQIFFEQLLIDFPRDKAPGKWIDDLPDTKPFKSDISPRLSAHVLFHDKTAANAHWAAFQKRNPRTTAVLKAHMDRPVITEMPGKDIVGFIDRYRAQDARNYGSVRKSIILVKAGKRDRFCTLEEEKPLWAVLGARLLYADFLIARGDQTAKKRAYRILGYSYTSCEYLRHCHEDKTEVVHAVANEIVWPNLDWKQGRYRRNDMIFVKNGVKFKYGHAAYQNTAECFRIRKWVIAHTDLELEKLDVFRKQFRKLQYLSLILGYGTAKDQVGILLCRYASLHQQTYTEGTLEYVRQILTNLYGQSVGAVKYRDYLKMIDEQFHDPNIKNAMWRADADYFQSIKNYQQAIHCLQQLDPQKKKRRIQQEIKNLKDKQSTKMKREKTT